MLRTLLIVAFLSGCARFQDGYQFGDITMTLLDAKHTYCTSANPVARYFALGVIKFYVPGYPTKGICTDAFPEQPQN